MQHFHAMFKEEATWEEHYAACISNSSTPAKCMAPRLLCSIGGARSEKCAKSYDGLACRCQALFGRRFCRCAVSTLFRQPRLSLLLV